jgi:capsular exopolysaccharide synthesis family protein
LVNGLPVNITNNDRIQQQPTLYDRFMKYLWIVRKRLWLVILFGLFGGVYRYNNVKSVQPIFSSSAIVILDGAATDRAVALLGIPGARYGYQNELYILRSEALSKQVAEAVVDQFYKSGRTDTVSVLKNYSGGIDNLDRIAYRLRSKVRFYSKEENKSIIEITALGNTPEEAAQIANTYAYTYKKYNRENSKKQVLDAKSYLKNQIVITSDSLLMIERQIVDFYRNNGYNAAEKSTETLAEQISELYKSLDERRLRLAANKEEILAIDSTLIRSRERETASMLETPDAFIEYYETKIKELNIAREEELARTAIGTNQDNSIISITEAKINLYKEKLRFYIDKKLDNSILLSNVDGSLAKHWIQLSVRKIDLENEARTIPEQIKQIEAKIQDYNQKLETLPFLELEYQKLTRKKTRYEDAIKQFYSKLIETELAEASEGGYVDVLDNAKTNYNQINSPPSSGLVQGVLLGGLIAIGLILLLDKIDGRIKSNEDLESFPYRIAGAVPSMAEYIVKEFGGRSFMEHRGHMVSSKLISVLKPLSGTSEMYRRLRSLFLFSLPDKKNKSIVVTSANPQEGKSVTISNLSIVLAQSGKRVLLIDTDLRRPNLDMLFGIPNAPGMSDAIVHGLNYEEVTYPTVAENLFLIPAGNQVPNPAEIIGSDAFKRFYNAVIQEYDFVIFDSPPTNSVVDALTIAEMVDMCLVVVKAGKTKKHELQMTINLLHFVSNKIVGILLNDISNKNFINDYTYYGNYNYYGNRDYEIERVTGSRGQKGLFKDEEE